jgi:hypothetical protein
MVSISFLCARGSVRGYLPLRPATRAWRWYHVATDVFFKRIVLAILLSFARLRAKSQGECGWDEFSIAQAWGVSPWGQFRQFGGVSPVEVEGPFRGECPLGGAVWGSGDFGGEDGDVVVGAPDQSPFDAIRGATDDCSLVFLGLPVPEDETTADELRPRFRDLMEQTRGLPTTAFVMASESVDFTQIVGPDK